MVASPFAKMKSVGFASLGMPSIWNSAWYQLRQQYGVRVGTSGEVGHVRHMVFVIGESSDLPVQQVGTS
jgi:hypothetical protein